MALVALSRDELSYFVRLHRDEAAPLWLTRGALRYLRANTDFEFGVFERVSCYLVDRLFELDHLRHDPPVSVLPPSAVEVPLRDARSAFWEGEFEPNRLDLLD